MESIDIVIGVLLIVGLIRGFWRGLIIEMASLLAIVLGIYGAIHFSFYVGNYLNTHFNWNQDTTKMIAFLATLVGIMVIVMLLGKILTKILHFVALGFINRLFGAIFGALKIAIIIGATLLFLSRTNQTSAWIPQKAIETSVLYSPIKSIGELVYAHIMGDSTDSKGIPPALKIPLPDIKPFDTDTISPTERDSISRKKSSEDTIPVDEEIDTINWKQII